MSDTVSIRVAVEGEDEFKRAVANINASTKLLKSELAKLDSEQKGNANSIEALSAKGAKLSQMQSLQTQKVDECRKALEAAQAAQQKYADTIAQSGVQIAAAENRLDELKKSTGDSAKEQAELTEQLEKYRKEQAEAQKYQEAAGKGVAKWQTSLNYAQRDLNTLNGKIEDNAKYMDEAKRSTDGHATSIDEYGKKARDAGDKSAKALNALASALAAAGVAKGIKEIAQAMQACVDASIEFESALAGVYKTVDGTPEQLAAISDGIRELSTRLPATTTEIASVAEAAGQLGIATGDVLSFSRVMLDLGESTNLSADEAASALAKFANITGTAANDYERLGSVIVGLGNNFATTEADIVEMSTRLASAGTLAGLTEAEIMALATAMSSVGIEAEAGGTAMTQTLAAMETAVAGGGAKLDEFARIAGMSAAGFKTAWETDAISAIRAFISGLGDLDEQGESATLVLDEMGLSGVRQSNMLKSLALASGTLTSAVELANQAWVENTALANEANKRYETTESRLAMCENAARNMETAIGDALAPALRDVAEVGTDAFSWAAAFVEENPWLIQALTGVITTVGLLTGGLTALAVAVPVIKAVQASLLGLGAAAGPVIGVVAAVSALAGVAVTIGTAAAAASDAVPAVRELTAATQASADALDAAKRSCGDSISTTMAAAKVADAYIERLEALEAGGLRTEAQTKEYHDTLALLCQVVPELAGHIDLETDSIEGGTQALRDNTDAWRENARQQAYQEYYNSVYANYSAVLIEAEENSIRLRDAQAAAKVAAEGMDTAYQSLLQSLGMTDEQFKSTYHTVEDIPYRAVSEDVAGLREEFISFKGQLSESEQAARIYENAVRASEGATEEARTAVETAEQAVKNLAGATETATEKTGEAGNAVEKTTGQIEELIAKAETLESGTKALADAQDMLTAALDEQRASGSLSLDTALKLIGAGYAAALAIDEESSAVIFNRDKYVELAQAKLKEQIRSLETDRSGIVSSLNAEAQAALDAANANYDLAISKLKVDEATVGAVASYDAQISALKALQKNLGSYSYESQRTVRASASSSKKVQTKAEKDLAKFKEIKAQLDHQKTMDEVDEREYYARLAQYRDQYLSDDSNLDDYRKITEEIYKYDQKLAQEENKLWEEQTGALISQLEDRVKSIRDQQDSMARDLSGYGDLFKIEDDQMALENIQSQIDALNEYENTLSQLRERGISDSLMDKVLGMGVDDGAAYGKALLEKTDEQWEEYNALWEEKQRRAVEIAAKFYQDQLDALKTEYDEKLGAALGELTNTAFTSGQDTAQGLIDGLSAKESELYGKAQSIANEVARIMASAYAAAEVDGSHAGGLAFVPYDGYVAQLHQGERVLTAQEAKDYIARATPRNFDPPNQTQGQQDLGSMLSQAVNAMSGAGNALPVMPADIKLVTQDGKTLARWMLPDLRAVMKSSPEVVSDL